MTQGARAGQGLAQRFPDAWLGGARRAPHAARARRALALQPALLPSRICVKPRQAGGANVRQAGVLERRFQRRRSQLSRHRALGSWRGGRRGCQQRGKKDWSWSQAKRPPAIFMWFKSLPDQRISTGNSWRFSSKIYPKSRFLDEIPHLFKTLLLFLCASCHYENSYDFKS